jgi:hypothetical protein
VGEVVQRAARAVELERENSNGPPIRSRLIQESQANSSASESLRRRACFGNAHESSESTQRNELQLRDKREGEGISSRLSGFAGAGCAGSALFKLTMDSDCQGPVPRQCAKRSWEASILASGVPLREAARLMRITTLELETFVEAPIH